jgi:medium-chain acyl-[acyl-carrier-protein] hydrolase
MDSPRDAPARSRWLAFPAPNPSAAGRLLCLPHAGAGAATFRDWPRGLPPGVELVAVQLPGRESRLAEPPLDTMTELLPRLAEALRPYLDRPFALLGHSMGARVAFELARHLRRSGPRPATLYVSGCPAPQLPARPAVHDLPRDQFVTMLRRLGGTPSEVFDLPELLEMVLPVLRADFAVVETCTYTDEPPLDCRVVAFCGREDPEATPAEVEAWRAQTGSAFTMHVMDGGHFFLHERRADLLRLISADLNEVMTGPP